MTNIRNGLRIILILTVVLLTCFVMQQDAYAKERKIKTYITGVDIVGKGFTEYTVRYCVKSYYLGKQVSYSRRREIGEIKNTSKKTATRSLSLSKSTSRAYSISVSTVIPAKMLQSDVSATIGGSLSFNNTITISASAPVPPGKSRSVYLQYKTSRDKYKYVVQKQIKSLYGKWRNQGKVTIKYNTCKTKVPVLVI